MSRNQRVASVAQKTVAVLGQHVKGLVGHTLERPTMAPMAIRRDAFFAMFALSSQLCVYLCPAMFAKISAPRRGISFKIVSSSSGISIVPAPNPSE